MEVKNNLIFIFKYFWLGPSSWKTLYQCYFNTTNMSGMGFHIHLHSQNFVHIINYQLHTWKISWNMKCNNLSGQARQLFKKTIVSSLTIWTLIRCMEQEDIFIIFDSRIINSWSPEIITTCQGYDKIFYYFM